MLIPLLSLAALGVAIALSIFSRLNVGLLALGFAYALGILGAGMTVKQVNAGFPVNLLLTLLGLTLLFGHARANGTLDRIAGFAVQLGRGRPGLLPMVFFVLAALLGTIGAGNIGAVALLAPIGMAVAHEAGVPPFLMALMIACGGNAAALSPLAPTGVIAVELMQKISLPNSGWHNYLHCLLAHTLVGFGGYFSFGGIRLLRDRPSAEQASRIEALLAARQQPFATRHLLTLTVMLALLVSVSIWRLDVGALALGGALLLTLLRASDEEQAMQTIPWGTVLMVCGMTTLMAILERTGGISLFTRLLVLLSTPHTAPGVMGLVTGVLSAYSSSSGVVLPAFLPMIPGLIQKLGGGNALALADSVNVGAHLVDVSPLSTLGALCLAHAAKEVDTRILYRQLLAWGLSMAVVGALYCYVVFGLLRHG